MNKDIYTIYYIFATKHNLLNFFKEICGEYEVFFYNKNGNWIDYSESKKIIEKYMYEK